MTIHLKLSTFILSVLIVNCCGNQHDTVAHLADIESYINDRPDSALAELRAIDTTILRSRRDKAQYSLLHAMALDKCYIDVISDSIIAPAAKYYRHHGSADERMNALLYQAKTHKNREELKEAAILYSQAEEWAEKAIDRHSKGILFLSFSSLYNTVYNLDKQQAYIEKALETLEGTGDPLYERALGQLAIPYMMRREWSTADSLFQRAMASSEDYPEMMKFIIHNYGRMRLIQDKPDPEGALTLFNLKMEKYGTSLTPAEAGAYAYASARLGDDVTTDALIQRFNGFKERDWKTVLPWMYRISAWRGDYQSAFKYLSEADINEENTIQVTLTDSITQALQDHKELSLRQERIRRVMIILFSALLLLISACFVLVISLRKRNLQHEMDSLLSIHDALKTEHEALKKTKERIIVSTGNKKKDKLQQIQAQLQKERIDSFRQRRIFDYVLWMNENHFLSDANTLKAFKEEILSFYNIERNQERLEEELDKAMNGIVSDLKKDLGINSPKDVHFLCLWLIDTKTVVVSEILGLNDNAVYIKRSRLKKSIMNLGDKYSFLFG